VNVETIPFAVVTIHTQEIDGRRVLGVHVGGEQRGTLWTSSPETALAMAAKGALGQEQALAVSFAVAAGAGCEDGAALATLVAEPCLIVVERWSARYLILPVRAGVVDYG